MCSYDAVEQIYSYISLVSNLINNVLAATMMIIISSWWSAIMCANDIINITSYLAMHHDTKRLFIDQYVQSNYVQIY